MQGFSTAVLFAEGATSQVYRAIDETSGRPVAVKVLKSSSPDIARRFRFEAEVLARLDHPGIARLVDAGEWDSHPFLATEFIDGAAIDQALADQPTETIVRVFIKVADALAHAHDNGLLHRDLKPANVLVRRAPDGDLEPVIVDFGLAADLAEPQQTASGALLGTPAFMAPEQAKGARSEIGRSTDIYGLGAVLYATLAGRPPYTADNAGDLIAAILGGPPPRPGARVPRPLEAIIDCAMARRSERRYGSARRMAADLTAWLDGQSVRAMHGFRWRLAGRTMRRHWGATAAVLATVLILGLLGLQQVWLKSRAADRQELALALNERLALSRERMRLAHLAPRHDITPALERLEREIEALERVAAQRSTGEAPALGLVLGQMLLDIGRYDEAVSTLESARRQGCRSERCATSLALGYLQLYERDLERRLAFSDSATEGDTPVELIRARELVAESRHTGRADLRLAALSQPLEEVVRRVELRVAEEPWQYDAVLALAESRYRAGLEDARADRVESAMRLLAAAERDFEHAATIARSLPAAYLGACRARARRMEIVTTGRIDAGEGLDDLPDSCRYARLVLPGHAASYSLPGLVYERLATKARRAGAHDRAAEFIGAALAVLDRAPPELLTQPALQVARARVLTTSVRVERLDTEEAAARLREALALARSATETDPALTPAWHARAIALGLLSARAVDDAAELAREAVETADRVAQRWPEHRSVRNLLGSSLLDLAYRQRLRDGAGEEALGRALVILERLVEDAPDYDSALNNLGLGYLELALHRLDAGEEFEAVERRSRQALGRVLERRPSHPSARLNLSTLHLTVAERLIDRGLDPGDRVQRSLRLLSELRADGDDLPCDLAFAHWLAMRSTEEPVARRESRSAARAHALRGDGGDCGLVLERLEATPSSE